jgi:hypothetical protein
MSFVLMLSGRAAEVLHSFSLRCGVRHAYSHRLLVLMLVPFGKESLINQFLSHCAEQCGALPRHIGSRGMKDHGRVIKISA